MIKTKSIKFKVSSILKKNYSNLGYDFSKEVVEIKIEHLKDVSQARVDVVCDLCNQESNIIYAKYIKNVKRNGVYSCKSCGLEKRSYLFTTNNLSLNPEFQEKKRQTFIKNHGVDNPSKSPIIKSKKVQTLIKNYGVDYLSKIKKMKIEGMINKYGVESPLQSDIIYDKMVSSLLEKYNVDNVSKLDNIKSKKRETCLEKYGVDCNFKSDEIKELIRCTNIRRYGVENPMQCPIIFKKQLLSAFKIVYYNDSLFYQGTYELDFLKYCDKKGILDIVSNGPSIKYLFNDVEHTYHPDFFIESMNLIVEVKSSYTYNKELDVNLMKEKYSMLCGYNFLFIIDKDYTKFNNLFIDIYRI